MLTRRQPLVGVSLALGASFVLGLGCGARVAEPTAEPASVRTAAPTAGSHGRPAAPSLPSDSSSAGALASATAPPTGAEPKPCPDDMVYVDTVHCPDSPEFPVRLRCLRDEYNSPNHLVICHEFAPGQQCRLPLRRQRFCIDRYEYPNEQGGHPPVMVSAFDAAALCAERGKRLCWESEWTAACEGPDKLPFPYGLKRSKDKCNIDNLYVNPSLDNVYHKNPAIQDRELRKLDQSVRSGSMATCRSGFGVYDLTGNFDEWVLTEQSRGKSDWAGLKGGAWGHVRNACRPITTSHVAEFTYYFISTRCCRDADKAAAAAATAVDLPLWAPPPAPTPKPPNGKLSRGWAPK